MRFQASCNRFMWTCGCAEWDELESGEWVHKHWPCYRHKIAATEAA
jgi:hypothetical protein